MGDFLIRLAGHHGEYRDRLGSDEPILPTRIRPRALKYWEDPSADRTGAAFGSCAGRSDSSGRPGRGRPGFRLTRSRSGRIPGLARGGALHLLRGRLPREPAEPEIAAEDTQEDDHADHPSRPRLPDGLSPGGLVADLPDPREIIPPGNPRIGPRRGQAEGKTIGPQDQLGIPVRIGRLRLAGDGREPVIHDQLGFPGGVGRHRGSRTARDSLWIADARSGASIQLFEDLACRRCSAR